MNSRNLVALLVSAAVGVVAVYLAHSRLGPKDPVEPAETIVDASERNSKIRPVVVAARDFQFGDRIDAQMLQVVDWPTDSVPTGAYDYIDHIVTAAGAPVALTRIAFGEPILDFKISGEGQRGSLSALIDR